ncbi:competence protein CoiA family protein [Alkalihalobacillus sp. FSL R5-0424]
MLTAVLEDGTKISMADKWFEKELKELRSKKQFTCPACNARVTLKLGTKRQWHFAHYKHTTCRLSLEPESPYHLSGKLQLYNWLVKQKIPVSLEVYLPLIQQRPDLLCKVGNQLIAIEFQCSSLSEERFLERTQGYQQIGITPIWIIGGNRLRRKQGDVFQILGFEWLTARKDRMEQMNINYYCPESSQWILLKQIRSFSTTRALAQLSCKKNPSVSLDTILHPSILPTFNPMSWLRLKKAWRYPPVHPYLSKERRMYQKWLYHHNISPGQFPAEAGWFLPVQHFIETSPHIWQTIILVSSILPLTVNQSISLSKMKKNLTPFMYNRILTFRTHPFNSDSDLLKQMILEYMCLLKLFGVYEEKGDTVFILKRSITLPLTPNQANQFDMNLSKISQNTPNFHQIQR